MASATLKWYGYAGISLLDKLIDWDTDAIYVCFTPSTHTPNQDSDQFLSAIGTPVSGTNWAAAGVQLTTCTKGYTGATNVIKLDADDVSVASVTATDMKNVHVYDRTPATDAARPLIGYGVLDAALNPNNGTVTVNFDVAGVLTMTAA